MDKCPNGYICINHFNAFGIIILLMIGFYIFNKENYKKIYSKLNFLETKTIQESNYSEKNNHNHNNIYSSENHSHQNEVNNGDNYQVNNGDDYQVNNGDNENIDRRLIDNSLYPPLSRNPYIKKGVPINIETRESGGDFQQVGILSKTDISNNAQQPGNNNESVVLPLYGKPLHRGSTKWLYYTETDRNRPIKIPIVVNNVDCTDDRGCDEIYDGGTVSIPSLNGDFNVKLYKFNKPRYIPYI